MIHKYVLRDKNRKLSQAFAHDIFIGPYVTERSATLSESNKIVVKVIMEANKIDIKRAFEMVFEVPVESVNTMISKPKVRHFKGKVATRSPFKKAVIQVKKGFDINKIVGAV